MKVAAELARIESDLLRLTRGLRWREDRLEEDVAKAVARLDRVEAALLELAAFIDREAQVGR